MHEKEIEIRWRDLDAFGHVNHVVFLTYLEEVRDEWLGRSLGDPALVWDYVVARVEIDYRRELTLADDVVVATLRARAHRDEERDDARVGSSRAPARRPPRRRRCSSRATATAARGRSPTRNALALSAA